MDLYRAISEMEQVVAIAQTSNTLLPALVSADAVFASTTVVFLTERLDHFGILTSAVHQQWALKYGSSMKNDARYIPSRCFETFPQPVPGEYEPIISIAAAARNLTEYRSAHMISENLGLTRLYGRINDSNDNRSETLRLRDLHQELDHAVLDSYGWLDVELGHGHWGTSQGTRFTICPSARDEILDRLLELNHQRYAQDNAGGMHAANPKKSANRGRTKKADNNQQGTLL
jgi:hypothetical protein